MAKKKFQLSFSPDLVNVPITYRMVKDYRPSDQHPPGRGQRRRRQDADRDGRARPT